MVAEVGRLSLDEYLLEASLSARKHIVVEGPTDRRFFDGWLLDVGAVGSVSVTAVEYLDVNDAEVLRRKLPLGNRARVLVVAAKASDEGVDLRCVADRDCGHDVETYTYETLRWTDYPALESYAVSVETLDRANLLGFAGRLPEGGQLLEALAHALREMFAVRVQHQHLPRPKFEAGLPVKGLLGLKSFDVRAVVSPALGKHVAEYARSKSSEPRDYAYGHDVAELLYAAFGNTLKNQLGLSKIEAVEAVLLSATQLVGSFRVEPLFSGLEEWIGDSS